MCFATPSFVFAEPMLQAIAGKTPPQIRHLAIAEKWSQASSAPPRYLVARASPQGNDRREFRLRTMEHLLLHLMG
jgi:hypothetical protein